MHCQLINYSSFTKYDGYRGIACLLYEMIMRCMPLHVHQYFHGCFLWSGTTASQISIVEKDVLFTILVFIDIF